MNKPYLILGIFYFAIGGLAQFVQTPNNLVNVVVIALGITEFIIATLLILHGMEKLPKQKVEQAK